MGAQSDTSTSTPEVWHGVQQILAPIFVPRLLATYLERFYADWTASSAGRLGNHLFDHWAMRFSDYDDGRGQGRQLAGIPVWLTLQTMPKIETQPSETVFALIDRLQRFDERLG